RRRIIAERGGGGPAAAVDPSGHVDLPVQHRRAELLDRLGQRGGGGPAAVARDARNAEEEGEDESHQAGGAATLRACSWMGPTRPSTCRRGRTASGGPRPRAPPRNRRPAPARTHPPRRRSRESNRARRAPRETLGARARPAAAPA